MKRRALLLCMLLAACKRGGDSSPPPAPTGASDAVLAPPAPTSLWPDRRTPCPVPAYTRAEWSHTRSKLVAASGDPRHVAADAIVAAGSAPRLDGKFAYSAASKDLEDEIILPFIASGGCTAVPAAAARTDDDGRASATTAALPAGHHSFWLVTAADGTHATAGLWVVPPGTPAILFDVDGTLTTDDGELFDDLLGDSAAAAFPNAAAVVQRWAAKGYLIIYVTGRPYPLRDHTRRWLEAGGFPYGPLFTPDRLRSAVPTPEGVGEYKREILLDLQARGITVARAYGNAATDVCAYAQAKISPSITYIIGNRGGCAGSPAPNPLAGYVDHLPSVDAHPDAAR